MVQATGAAIAIVVLATNQPIARVVLLSMGTEDDALGGLVIEDQHGVPVGQIPEARAANHAAIVFEMNEIAAATGKELHETTSKSG